MQLGSMPKTAGLQGNGEREYRKRRVQHTVRCPHYCLLALMKTNAPKKQRVPMACLRAGADVFSSAVIPADSRNARVCVHFGEKGGITVVRSRDIFTQTYT
jgi:hypothetical protein